MWWSQLKLAYANTTQDRFSCSPDGNRNLSKPVLKMDLCLLIFNISSLIWCSCLMPELGIPLLAKVSTTIKFDMEDFSIEFTNICFHICTKETSFQRALSWNVSVRPKAKKIIKAFSLPLVLMAKLKADMSRPAYDCQEWTGWLSAPQQIFVPAGFKTPCCMKHSPKQEEFTE